MPNLATRLRDLTALKIAERPPRGADSALAAVGRLIGVDRAYVFLFDAGGQSMSNTQEWCAAGIAAQRDRLQKVPVSYYPWWMGELRSGREIRLDSLADLPPEAAGERALLELQEIRSLLVLPMTHAGRLIGFAGFDQVRTAKVWREEEIAVLRIVAGNIAGTLAPAAAGWAGNRPSGHRAGGAPRSRAATSLSLRWRVMLLAMSMVAMVVVLMAVAVYAVVSAALYTDIDRQLQTRAQLLIASGSLAADPGKAIEGTAYSDVNAMLVNPGRSIYTANQQGQSLPIGQPERAVIRGDLFMSRRTVVDQRVLAIHLPNGSSLLISKSLQPTNEVMDNLKWVLLAVGGIGVVIAAVAGGMVARTGLRPVGRLTEAAERVARTDDLRPIPVFGSDELARLTEAFNAMLRGLAESRERQARLVADAGHELKTPLTSLRTNVELLMASSSPGAPAVPEQELAELRADVIGQIEELSTLVGDLVDLTREDNAHPAAVESVDMSEVIDRSLERVRRRRNDIQFDIEAAGWLVRGDPAGLSRAVLNLLDNAAKWSPPGGTVGLRLRQVDPAHAELVVSDQGPGIPPEERDLVFERFYRSTSARAMPGSGLGLAIVRQVVVKHGGMIRIGETVPGGQPPGTSFFVLLPGRPIPGPRVPASAVSENAGRDGDPTTADGNHPARRSVISVDSQ
jgi:two-component system, OmpR family, sensor histidine kinase MprB